jgi:WD40 repeat protein/serine/threonine protein kinase
MGVVYKAEQRGAVRRLVALKLLKPGVDSREVVARFEAERQALAMMSHEHVAKVFDAGMTEAGLPYFVMEYVAGESITTYCDHQKLNTRSRLELFVQACEAVQHAHQKAILHRDIKPSNVLVAVDDQDRPVVKVIDFGVAKALTQRLTDQTLFTEHGRLIGTPEYMSPEQAAMSRLDVDTRTDIYSLGVVLYELLTGALPFDPVTLRQAAFDELRRIIREEEPPKPSTRLGSLGADAERVARCHSARWDALCRELRGELEWIPLKAMRKERAERYRSASELADDVRNYLQCRPLIAGPESTAYRAWKFVAKHSRAVAVAASVLAVLVAMVAALAVTTRRAMTASVSLRTQKVEADRLRDVAEDRTHQLEVAHAAQNLTTKALAHSLVTAGDSFAELGRVADARERYLQAVDAFDGLGEPRPGLPARLLAVADPAAMPLIGAYARSGVAGGFAGHEGRVDGLAVSDDGRTAITASQDKTLKLWDLLTGNEIRTFDSDKGHGGGVAFVAFAPGSKTALSAGDDGRLVLWDVATGRPSDRWDALVKKVWVVAFSPDGTKVISGGEAEGSPTGTRAELWDIGAGRHRHVRSFAGHGGAVAGAAFSPRDGRTVLTASHDGTIRLWDVETGSEITPPGGFRGHTGKVNCVGFSPDGATAVSAGFDGNVFLWDVASGTRVGLLKGHTDWVWRAAFSPDGRRVVSGSKDGTVRVWEVKSGRELRQYSCGEGSVMFAAFLPDGRGVVSSRCGVRDPDWPAAQPALSVWPPDADSEVEGGTLATRDLKDAVTAAAVSDDRTVLVGTAGGTVAVWDARAKRVLVTLPLHAGPVRAVSLSRDGRHALSAGADGVVKLCDVDTGREVARLPGGGAVNGLAFIGGGDRALAGSEDGKLRLWEPDPAQPPAAASTLTGAPDARMTAWGMSPDGQSALAACEDGQVFQWDVKPGAPTRPTPLAARLRATVLTWSPGAHAVLYTKAPPPPEVPGLLCLAELETGNKRQLEGHEARVTAVAFSPDGAAALTGDEGGTVILWSIPERSRLKSFQAHAAAVNGIAFAPGGGCAVSFGADKTVRLWDFGQAIESAAMEKRARAARETLARTPADPAALAVLVNWYAFRGRDDWAVRLYDSAGGAAPVSHLSMGRCFWRLGDVARANAEFKKALERNEGSVFCARLCFRATSPAAGAISDSSASARP